MITYQSMHRRIVRLYGPASSHPCLAFCGNDARHWAYIGLGHDSGELRYSESLDDYIPLCVPCHRRFDGWDAVRTARASVLVGAPGKAGKIGGVRTAAIKRTCSCGTVMNPGNLVRHQSASGHIGYTT